MNLDPERQWECPRCGDLLEAQGPASLNYQVTNHRWQHEREDRAAERGNPAMPGYQGGHGGVTGSPYQEPLYGATLPKDDAFYDGARLTAFDWGFLRTAHIAWNPPRKSLTGAR